MATDSQQEYKHQGETIKIRVKTQTRNEEFVVAQVATVAEIKPEIAQRFDAETNQLCLIYAGRPLADSKTLTQQNVQDGFAIHLVIRPKNNQPSSEPPKEARINHEATNPLNDITTSLLSNPDYIRALISMDPRLQAYLEQNPDVGHAINNPNIMREYLQIVSNPGMMQEFLRGQDLTMRNMENMPGGFAALQSIYNNISELDETMTPINNTTFLNNTQPVSDQPSRINSSPLPNPWSTDSAAQPTDGYMPDPQLLIQMLTNPQIQQLLRDLSTDPSLLQTVFNNNSNLGDSGLQQYLQTNLPNAFQTLQNMPAENLLRRVQSGSPEDMYGRQLEQLSLMGFENREANLRALVVSMGDLNAAIDVLTRNLN